MHDVPSLPEHDRTKVMHVLDLCRASQKFCLPEDGMFFVDNELRALDDSIPLRLPHPFVALEYLEKAINPAQKSVLIKRVLFVREDSDEIYITRAAFVDANGFWVVKHDIRVQKKDYLDRKNKGLVVLNIEIRPGENRELCHADASVVIRFLNALACSNVHIERNNSKASSKKVKSALPFDEYHVLTIDIGGRHSSDGNSGGIHLGHRSPREHLRRGHIVRPEGRRPFWRNATVVCAGRGFAKVEKDYRLKSVVV